MKIILDVNIILSALIRDSATRKIIIESGLEFYFPEPSLGKIRKYNDYIIEKSGLTLEEYRKVLATLFQYIRLIPAEEIRKRWEEAKEIMSHIDPEDVTFIAAALGLENSIVWSDDKDFDEQSKVRVLKTQDIMNLFHF